MGENNQEMGLREALAAGFGLGTENDASAPEAQDAAGQEMPVQEMPGEETGNMDTQVQPGNEVPGTVGGNPAPDNSSGGSLPPADNTAVLLQMIQQQQQQIAQLTQQMQQQNQAMVQQSDLARNAVESAMEPPAPEPYPVMDFAQLTYKEPEERDRLVQEWQAKFMERAAQDILKKVQGDFAPIREQYESNRRIAEAEAAREKVFNDPRFSDFRERAGAIADIIAHTPALENFPAVDRYAIAGLMDRGMRHANPPTTEEIITMAKNNPDVMRAIMAQQAAETAKTNADVPKIAASSGMAQAQAIPEDRPKNMQGVKDRIFARLR